MQVILSIPGILKAPAMIRLIVPSPLAVGLSAAIVFCSGPASSHTSKRCLGFAKSADYTESVSVGNACPNFRGASIRWCDGTKLKLRVSALGSRSLQAFPGCKMQIVADIPLRRIVKLNVKSALGSNVKTTPPCHFRSSRAITIKSG